MKRRAFLAACAAAGVAGCRTEGGATDEGGGGDSGGSTAEPNPTPTPARDGSTATATPTEQSTPIATESPTVTPSATATGTPIPPGYGTTEVAVTTPGGEELGSVTAAIADTRDRRYTGLSETENLPEDRGMLFVYDEVDDHTYVMREMDFAVDIIYADDEGVITRIHHAPEPGPDEDGESQRYPGRGQYVLEVTYEWTTERGVEEGDMLAFKL